MLNGALKNLSNLVLNFVTHLREVKLVIDGIVSGFRVERWGFETNSNTIHVYS
jgi:hypothetical protein